jgi:hypothetical protein
VEEIIKRGERRREACGSGWWVREALVSSD